MVNVPHPSHLFLPVKVLVSHPPPASALSKNQFLSSTLTPDHASLVSDPDGFQTTKK